MAKPPAQRACRKALLAQLEREVQAVARMRKARLLAAVLLRQFEIFPEGIDLVCWLADSSCRTNSEALANWIECQLRGAEVAKATAADELAHLQKALARRLMDIGGSYAC